MSREQEHRGWEPSSEYHVHPLDDPEWSFNDVNEGSGAAFIALLIIGVLAVGGMLLLTKWVSPPPVVFQPPRVVEFLPTQFSAPQSCTTPQGMTSLRSWGPIPSDWHYSYLRIDEKHKMVMGNCKVYPTQ